MSRVVSSGSLFISENPGPNNTVPMGSATLRDLDGNIIDIQIVQNTSDLKCVENFSYLSGTYSFGTNYTRTYYKDETYTDSEGNILTREVLDYVETFTTADISVSVTGSIPPGISHVPTSNYSGLFSGTPSESIHGRSVLPVDPPGTYPTIPFTLTVTGSHDYQSTSFSWTIWVVKNWDEEAQDFLDSIN